MTIGVTQRVTLSVGVSRDLFNKAANLYFKIVQEFCNTGSKQFIEAEQTGSERQRQNLHGSCRPCEGVVFVAKVSQ